jgi:hypothetical protein
MWKNLPAHTRLYRITRSGEQWPGVLQGIGSFFNAGGRYNLPHQMTVYASDDPLVALAEFAYHQVISWCEIAALDQPLPNPLRSSARLWCFKATRSISLIDISHSAARNQFNYPAHAPSNPNDRVYTSTQSIANRIRNFSPQILHVRPEGIWAPSVRTPRIAKYQPRLCALFVFPPNVGPGPLDAYCQLIANWEIDLEFRSTPPRRAVVTSTARIDWLTPRFRLRGNEPIVQPAKNRPKANAFSTNIWQDLILQFTCS